MKKRSIEDGLTTVIEKISRTSFTNHILRCPQPQRFVIPTFKLFNGKTNPEDYIYQYLQKMLMETEDALLI